MTTITKGKFEIYQFQAAHCARKKCYITKVFNRFSKPFLKLKDVVNRYLSRKFHGRSYFSFAMVMWKLFSGGKIRNFPLSRCTLCQKKMLYHQMYSTDFQKLPFLKDVENRYLAQKFHGRSYFSFAMVRWKLFSGGKNSNFPTFKLYTVSEKMLYHKSYSTDFQKLSFCWKMWKIGIWPKNVMGAAILISQW